MILTEKVINCRSCQSANLEIAWKLANSPYGDLFKGTEELALNVEHETLTLGFCLDCKMLQLLEKTNINMTYDDYLYRSSITNALNSFYKQTTNRLISDYALTKGSTIVDIGSNDGTFLVNFLEKGFKVIGVEPTAANARTAELRGVRTINEYFDEKSVEHILEIGPHPSLISINYTLANIPNLQNIVTNLAKLMDATTILSVITGYHPDQYAVNMFEYVNHDHLTYLTIESVANLCKRLGLKIIDANRSEHKGGSIQFVIAKESSAVAVQSSVDQLKQREIWMNCNSIKFTTDLAFRINQIGAETRDLLASLKYSHAYGIGASISTTYLCNEFRLNGMIEKLFDDDIYKVGRFAPGSGKYVESLSNIPKDSNGLAIILAWQHSEKLRLRLREVGFTGRVLVPLPTPTLIEF